jgi:hypothetical protein
MKPEKAYRHDIGAWELVQDGYCLGYIRRTHNLHLSHWLASTDGVTWHDRHFSDRAAAREYLETL